MAGDAVTFCSCSRFAFHHLFFPLLCTCARVCVRACVRACADGHFKVLDKARIGHFFSEECYIYLCAQWRAVDDGDGGESASCLACACVSVCMCACVCVHVCVCVCCLLVFVQCVSPPSPLCLVLVDASSFCVPLRLTVPLLWSSDSPKGKKSRKSRTSTKGGDDNDDDDDDDDADDDGDDDEFEGEEELECIAYFWQGRNVSKVL